MRCPGCNGDMSAGSQLCRFCRKRALDLGIRAVLEQAAGPRPVRDITPGQIRAFYGKAHALTLLRGQTIEEVHDEILAWASEELGREIDSVKKLDELEANTVLNHMTVAIADARRAEPVEA